MNRPVNSLFFIVDWEVGFNKQVVEKIGKIPA